MVKPGTQIGSYIVVDRIGEGANGVVFRAHHPVLDREVAIKMLRPGVAGAGAESRFRREALSLGRLKHPNIVAVYDFGDFEGASYLVLEYRAGGPLHTRFGAGAPMDVGLALEVGGQVAAGLDYAHSKGIVHRDIKPANILFDAEGTAAVADFGLVCLVASTSETRSGGWGAGSPAYMAPEQVMRGEEIGPAADRYAFAVTMFNLLAGRLPFERATVEQALFAHVYETPIEASKLNPDLSVGVDSVLARGMAKVPNARWESCAEFMSNLAAAAGAVVVATPVETVDFRPRALPQAGPVVLQSAPEPPPAGRPAVTLRPRRTRTVAAAVGAILVVVAIVGGIRWATSRTGPVTQSRAAPSPAPPSAVPSLQVVAPPAAQPTHAPPPAERFGVASYDRIGGGAPYSGFFNAAVQPFTAATNTITYVGVTIGNPSYSDAMALTEHVQLCTSYFANADTGGCAGTILADVNPRIVNFGSSGIDIGDLAVTPRTTYYVAWFQPAPVAGSTWRTYWWAGGPNITASDQMGMVVKGYNR